MITLQKIEEEIMKVMAKIFEAYENKDLDAVSSFFAPDPDVVLIGTGIDEKGIGMEQIRAMIKRDFDQADTISVEIHWKSISAAESFAWLSSDLINKVTVGDKELTLSGRLTALFENREDKWLIRQWHYSMPFSAQPEGQSFPK